MRGLMMVLAIAMMLAGCGNGAPSSSAAAPSAKIQITEDAAADLVRNFRVGSNLEQMAITVAKSTHTYGMVSPGRLTSEIGRLAPKYQAQWDSNLAKAIAAHLSPNELRSLANEGRNSPFYQKFERKKPAISADMKEMSSSILQQLVTEALTNSLKK